MIFCNPEAFTNCTEKVLSRTPFVGAAVGFSPDCPEDSPKAEKEIGEKNMMAE
jgi:hypothetical protein